MPEFQQNQTQPSEVSRDSDHLVERSDEDRRRSSASQAGTSYDPECDIIPARRGFPSRWILVPPKWAQLTMGCDFCTVQNAPRFILLVLLLTVLIFASQVLTPGKVEALLNWLNEDPWRGGVTFVVLLIGAHLVAFPCIILYLVGGAVYGLVIGALLVWIGTSVGQILAFAMGRFLLKDWVTALMSRHFPQWATIDAAISKEGWKLITLLRLSPIIPWNVLNYGLSVTGVPFLSFAIPSTFSILPWSTTTVYFGSLARDIADIFDGQVPLKGTAGYIFYLASGVVMVLVLASTTIVSRRAIREALINGNASGQEIVEELDNLTMFGGTPSDDPGDLRDRNFMSPSSNDWGRAFGWAGGSLQEEARQIEFAERTLSAPIDMRIPSRSWRSLLSPAASEMDVYSPRQL